VKIENEETNESSCLSCSAWKSSAFATLDSNSLELLRKSKRESAYQNNDIFSEKGKPATEVFCLKSGAAKVHLMGRNGEKSIVRLVAPGDMLGYRCIFSSNIYRGTASSIENSTACRIPKNTILELIERNAAFSKELLARMGKEIASAESRHQSFCQNNVRERLAEALLILNEKFGQPNPSGSLITVYLKRIELANWVGAAKETIIRTLSDFKEEGLINFEDNLIILKNLQLLQKTASFSSVEKPENLLPTQASLRQ
jgi:CRP/FNR family transcriptional regulator, polysaccharide utilization system transcription regulator